MFLPESPRWLVEHGQEERAARVLVKYHANGDENDPIVALEMAEIAQAIQQDREINATTSYKTLISNHANRYRTMIIIAIGFFSQWSGNGLISYYLSLILESIGYTDSQDQLMINGVLQAYNLVLGIAFAFIVNKFRRRTLWLFSTSGIFVTFIAWTICEALYEKSSASGSPNLAAGRAVLGLIFIYNFFFNSGWLTLQVVCEWSYCKIACLTDSIRLYRNFTSCYPRKRPCHLQPFGVISRVRQSVCESHRSPKPELEM
jgi:hypothetical protein